MEFSSINLLYGGLGVGLYSALAIAFSLRSHLGTKRLREGAAWPAHIAGFWPQASGHPRPAR